MTASHTSIALHHPQPDLLTTKMAPQPRPAVPAPRLGQKRLSLEVNENSAEPLTDLVVAAQTDNAGDALAASAQGGQSLPEPDTETLAKASTPADKAQPNAARPMAEPNGLSSFLFKPVAENAPSAVASWFGAAPTGAVLIGGGMALAGLQSKDKSNSQPTAADTQAPTLRSAEINDSTGSQLVLRYDEKLSSVLPSDKAFQVMVNGVSTTVTKVASGSDLSSLVLTLGTPVTRPSQITVSLSDGGVVKDLAGNTASKLRDQAVTFTDLVAPSLVTSQAISNGGKSVIVLRFSETLSTTTPPDLASFSVSAGGVVQTISTLEVLGDSLRLTLANPITTSNIFLNYTPPADTSKAIKDTAGNLAGAIGPGGGTDVKHSLDNSAPSLNTDALAVAATERQVRVIRLNFNEALDAGSLPDPSSFSVMLSVGGSTTGVAVSSLHLSGSTLELTLATTVTDSQASLQVTYARPSSGNVLKDWAGNPVAAFESAVTRVDSAAPGVVSSRFTNDHTLELTFNENLSDQGPATDTWSLTANGGNVLKPATSTVSGRTLTLTFATAIESGKSAVLSYKAPATDPSVLNKALQDSLGNDSGDFSRTLDTTGPNLVGAVTSANGQQIVLNYNEALHSANGGVPAAGAFTVRQSNGENVAVSTVTVSGTQVLLGLASTLKPSDNVSVFYVAPAGNIGVNNAALQDSSGNDAASLGGGVTGQTVTNNTVRVRLDSQAGALDQVVLQLGENIMDGLPAASAFTIKAGSITQTITGIAQDPTDRSKLVLSLAGPIDDAGALLVSYTPPSSNPLTGASGKALAAFSEQNFGHVITSSSSNDTITGAAGRVDYLLGSLGNDALSGLGGTDVFVWPDLGANGPGGFTQTLQDFGFKKGIGSLQGIAEADLLDLSQLLNGYTLANEASFLKAIKTAENKLMLQIDHDGGSVFAPTANLLFNNVTVNGNNELLVNNQFIQHTSGNTSANLTLVNLLEHLKIEGQLALL